MRNNLQLSYIIFVGILIITIFSSIIYINLDNKNESNSYYGKVNNEILAEIDDLYILNDSLYIFASGEPLEFCVKTTKSIPSINNICWQRFDNNSGSTNIYKYKKYYVWIKDINGNISEPESINS